MKNMNCLNIVGIEELDSSELENIEGGVIMALATVLGVYVGCCALADYAGKVLGDRYNS